MAVDTPTDRAKSVRNLCLSKLFCGVVCVVTLPFWHFSWYRGFCHRTESDLFLFVITVWNYHGDEIFLWSTQPTVNLNYFLPNNAWTLDSTRVENFQKADIDGMVKVELVLKRKPLYFCVSMLAPILLLAILNPLVFILPPESGERVSYAVTIFLSVAVFITLVSDHMPKSSSPISNTSYFLMTAVIFSAMVIVVTMFSMRLHLRGSSEKEPKCLRMVFFVLSFGILQKASCCKKNNAVSEINDEEKSTCTIIDKKPGKDAYKYLARDFDKIALGYSVVFIIITILVFFITIFTAP